MAVVVRKSRIAEAVVAIVIIQVTDFINFGSHNQLEGCSSSCVDVGT